MDFDLSIPRKNEIRSGFQIEETEKILLKTPVEAKNDPRLSYKLRIESTDNPEIRKEVVQEYIEWKASQIVAKELKDLSEDVIFKVR